MPDRVITIMSSDFSQKDIFDKILAYSNQAVLVLGLDSTVIYANNRAADLLGVDGSDVGGSKFSDIFDDKDSRLWQELAENAGESGLYSIDTVARLVSGRNIAIRINVRKDGNCVYFYISDNTDLNWLRQELRMTTEQMERNQVVAREKENYLRAIFRSTGIGIALLNLNGTIIECNSVFQVLTGKTIDQLRVSSFASYIHPDDLKGAVGIFNDLANGKCSHYQVEQRQLNARGDISWVKVSASLIRSNTGKPDYALFIVEDINEQKEAEESYQRSEMKYRTLFENMLDGFACHKAIRDDAGNIIGYEFTEINEAFASILGLERSEILGHKLSEVLDKTPFTLEWRKLYGKVDQTKIHIRHDIYVYQQEKWYSVLAYSPEPDSFVTFVEDITERRQIEEEIRVFATELECSNRELEHFVNRASGELTDRLEFISSGVKSLTGNCGEMCDNAKETLNKILLSTNSLQGMLDGLLVYSRMVYRGNPFDSVDLNTALEDVQNIFSSELLDGQLILNKSLLPTIEADAQQIKLLFEKIIEGLSLFSVSDVLAIDISNIQAGKYWNVTVEATHIDIPEPIVKIFFDVFRSFEYKNKTYSTGIHLPLCKKIMERHNGQIALSIPEAGRCCFHLTFPIPTIGQEK